MNWDELGNKIATGLQGVTNFTSQAVQLRQSIQALRSRQAAPQPALAPVTYAPAPSAASNALPSGSGFPVGMVLLAVAVLGGGFLLLRKRA